MIDVKVNPCDNFTFFVHVDGHDVNLSYRGFHGGKKAVENMGDAGFASLLAKTKSAIATRNSTDVIDFFNTVGVENAFNLISAVFPAEFKEYWKEQTDYIHHLCGSCSFRQVLQHVTGTSATLNHTQNPYIEELRTLCNSIDSSNSSPIFSVSEISGNGISISLQSQRNNQHLFSVNGISVPISAKNHRDCDCNFVWQAAVTVRYAVIERSDLKPLCNSLGGTTVFRLLYVVAEKDTYDYFRHLAQETIKRREIIFPRKILKNYLQKPSDDIKPFIESILSVLEQEANNNIDILCAGNDQEVLSDGDTWHLFYKKRNHLMAIAFDFSKICDSDFRLEVQRFLRDLWHTQISVGQLARKFYHIRDAVIAMQQQKSYHSITDFTPADAVFLKTELVKKYQACNSDGQKAYAKAKECFGVLRRYYFWGLAISGAPAMANPFDTVKFFRAQNFQSHIIPAEVDDLQFIAEHTAELPEYVALAHELLCLTYARAMDVFEIRVSAIDFVNSRLLFTASKNGRLMNFYLPPSLAQKINKYIESTDSIRKLLSEDYLFVYRDCNLRSGSTVLPRVLSANTYTYHVNKLLKSYGRPGKISARPIRAEGGRRDHSAGMSDSDRAIRLGNTEAVARKNYTTYASRSQLLEYAQLLHKNYEERFSHLATSKQPVNNHCKRPTPIWGTCDAEDCPNQNTCHNCPFLILKAEDV